MYKVEICERSALFSWEWAVMEHFPLLDEAITFAKKRPYTRVVNTSTDQIVWRNSV